MAMNSVGKFQGKFLRKGLYLSEKQVKVDLQHSRRLTSHGVLTEVRTLPCKLQGSSKRKPRGPFKQGPRDLSSIRSRAAFTATHSWLPGLQLSTLCSFFPASPCHCQKSWVPGVCHFSAVGLWVISSRPSRPEGRPTHLPRCGTDCKWEWGSEVPKFTDQTIEK